MKSKILKLSVFALLILAGACQMAHKKTAVSGVSIKIKGLSFVAPRQPISEKAMAEVRSINANWIAVIPYGFTSLTKENRRWADNKIGGVRFHRDSSGWWGETPIGVRTCIDSAHQNGIKVMVKPQIWISGGWTGGMDYPDSTAWANWEREYEDYILTFAAVAQAAKAELFCIGTELKTATTKREAFWRRLIQKVRAVYAGQLTYAANWDEYDVVPFWDALDMVGIDAYFSLLQKDTPSVSELREAWKPTLNAMRAFQKKVNKPIAFTEYGYLDVDGCAYQSWALEKRLKEVQLNQIAQAHAIEALLTTFAAESWWQGGFIWKWHPESGRTWERDYSPQKKLGEKVLADFYAR
jgi:hypothetical protein